MATSGVPPVGFVRMMLALESEISDHICCARKECAQRVRVELEIGEGDVSCVCAYKTTCTVGVGRSEGYLREPSGVLDSAGGLAGGSTRRAFGFDFEGESTEDAGVLYSLFEPEEEEEECMIGRRGERRMGELTRGLGIGSWSLSASAS